MTNKVRMHDPAKRGKLPNRAAQDPLHHEVQQILQKESIQDPPPKYHRNRTRHTQGHHAQA